MKTLFTLILIFCSTCYSKSQDLSKLREFLVKEFPVESTESDRWIFFPDDTIMVLDKPLLTKCVTKYTFYKTRLTDVLDYHINTLDCLILFDNVSSEFILVPPLGHSGINYNFLNLFIGCKFENKKDFLKFLSELKDVMLIGSRANFKNTTYTDTKIKSEITRKFSKNDNTWKTLEINLENMQIVSLFVI